MKDWSVKQKPLSNLVGVWTPYHTLGSLGLQYMEVRAFLNKNSMHPDGILVYTYFKICEHY